MAPPRPAIPAPDTAGRCIRLRLTVWPAGADGWSAEAELADGSRRRFESPFELARFVADPDPGRRLSRGGLR